MRVIVSSLLLLLSTCLLAQSSKDLKADREALLRNIKLTEQALEGVRTQEKRSLTELLLLEEQVVGREAGIRMLHEELAVLRKEMNDIEVRIREAEGAREQALNTYRRLTRYRLYYRLSELSPVMYILAAPQWQVLFQRMFLFDRLALRSREMARQYRDKQAELARLHKAQQGRQDEVSEVLALEGRQQQQLLLEKKEHENLINRFRKDSQSLTEQLARQSRERERLEEAIAALIRKEIEAEKKARAKPSGSKKTTRSAGELSSAPEIVALSGSFEQAKGRLGWPISKGAIVRKFGPQQHPSLPQIKINNTGIDFRTEPSAPVMAVHEGVITGIQWVPGYAHTMIIRHGSYYSVYSNMETVKGVKGDRIKAGDQVGTAAVNPVSGASEIHFEIWKGKNRENPANWLTKKKS